MQVYLFDVATLWQKVNLKAAEKMRQLHDREREIGEFYGQLNNLLMVIEEAKKFLEWKELTSYNDTMERVRVRHVYLYVCVFLNMKCVYMCYVYSSKYLKTHIAHLYMYVCVYVQCVYVFIYF